MTSDRTKPAPVATAPSTRILVVEDDAGNALVTSISLHACGYTYDMVRNAEDALRAITQTRYGVILMDMMLPGMDGVEAVARIRAYERKAGIAAHQIIALTVQSHIESEHSFLAAGTDGFLRKPCDMDELKDKIAMYASAQ